MKTVIIKYNAGNIRSLQFALERLGVNGIVTDDHEEIRSADKVIFPGVGEASTAMQYLKERNLDKVIADLKQPVLGICLGMQLLCRYSEENDTPCIGVFDVDVKKFQSPVENLLKIPQIGWNNIANLHSVLFEHVPENSYMYFVHSYYAALGADTVAITNYVINYSASLQKDNFYAVQFHPEKSAEAGARIIQNFLNI
ncbi:glutamine amidotransferase [Chitinophaga terrae (ex Kim and Jung 2007)]|jgi:glutamine amidotransferase|uniref:Imidazole glycerol phosphate synthase subunit HisH n=1 Tax=Chitinophaga terrae (ex Kim and Jung 2007) TaxID=408074 RepID=A0A1H3ZZT4_9BACT|nr:imidazole glycerol phosphate synthase subunit HisH [Chitinophaga terrae (ex Kim and Jung 2007)]MDQ0106112.1 glutamine amidotransferase [Chitinophaga terrae (ex Kim and Jung 2007)]GEP89963.1 imidazole glycerol phosphate synthase subunit HisH [Chitinophaga terrae (ex Kim and Jung 2007)]SEA29078.1 glutamine amidotransferase [Chitinophaga terrae (ex Kim and Jung 2007)]